MTSNAVAYDYHATVVRWVDGDTVWLDVDLGFRDHIVTDFRLYGVDTPERGEAGFKEASARMVELAPVGSTVTIATYKDPDKYGRWLAEIRTDNLADSLNTTLVLEGLAVRYYGGHRDKTPTPTQDGRS